MEKSSPALAPEVCRKESVLLSEKGSLALPGRQLSGWEPPALIGRTSGRSMMDSSPGSVVRFSCDRCSVPQDLPVGQAGARVRCSGCGNLVTVPDLPSEPAEDAPADAASPPAFSVLNVVRGVSLVIASVILLAIVVGGFALGWVIYSAASPRNWNWLAAAGSGLLGATLLPLLLLYAEGEAPAAVAQGAALLFLWASGKRRR
jgi:hypothetical protein